MKTPHTRTIFIGEGAADKLRDFVSEQYGENAAFVVCDENTARFTDLLPCAQKLVLPGNTFADTAISDAVLPEKQIRCMISCGSGSVTDITRHAAHRLGLPFISFPTAPSMDGYVSAIAAMTVRGQKLSVPSTPPIALFAEPAVYNTAPRRLTLSGVGDIIGKYISVADWHIAAILLGESVDPEIEELACGAVREMLALEPDDARFATIVLQGLIHSGMAIQMFGSSRPSSGAEHHFSHLWEMHCINEETDALHGEKVGVSTLMLLKRYRSLDRIVLHRRPLDPDYLRPVFGRLTEGIIAENTPSESDSVTQELCDAHWPEIRAVLDGLPTLEFLNGYYDKLGMKKTLGELGLPDTEEFAAKTFEFAPYTRKRLTLLRLIGAK